MGGPGIPAGFIVLMVLVPLIGLGAWLFRMSVATRMARQAGLDPTDAAMTTALSQDGLAATYVASNLANQRRPQPPTTSPESRLQQLTDMHAKGLVSDEEYAEQRKRILDAI
jgi:hypothetical protein